MYDTLLTRVTRVDGDGGCLAVCVHLTLLNCVLKGGQDGQRYVHFHTIKSKK